MVHRPIHTNPLEPMLANILLFATALVSPVTPADDDAVDPVDAILGAFDEYRIVAVGENHGHVELHDLILDLLEHPRAPGLIDDVAVEWGNALYQPVMDRYLNGEDLPWDSVAMAWRNTVVSPNTVWDAPVYERFFREVRRINAALPSGDGYRVLLADPPVEWNDVEELSDLAPYFDRAGSMAEVIRRESLLLGRRALFLAGGLHVHRRPRVRRNRSGIPVGEVTPVAWLELRHPGATYVIQSMARVDELGLDQLRTRAGLLSARHDQGLAALTGNAITTLRDQDGTPSDVYPSLHLGDLVDAVILWGEDERTFVEPSPALYRDEGYWQELNRRSEALGRGPLDPALRNPGA